MKTSVLGLGNPILGDDSVGMGVAGEIKKQIEDENVDIKEASVGGLGILDLIQGYDKVIIIDSIQTKDGRPGQLYKLEPSDFKETIHLSSPHDVNFATAIALGRKLKMKMPEVIDIYAVGIKGDITFTEECTPDVSRAIPKIVAKILAEEFG